MKPSRWGLSWVKGPEGELLRARVGVRIACMHKADVCISLANRHAEATQRRAEVAAHVGWLSERRPEARAEVEP